MEPNRCWAPWEPTVSWCNGLSSTPPGSVLGQTQNQNEVAKLSVLNENDHRIAETKGIGNIGFEAQLNFGIIRESGNSELLDLQSRTDSKLQTIDVEKKSTVGFIGEEVAVVSGDRGRRYGSKRLVKGWSS